jgi:hypothetical protein
MKYINPIALILVSALWTYNNAYAQTPAPAPTPKPTTTVIYVNSPSNREPLQDPVVVIGLMAIAAAVAVHYHNQELSLSKQDKVVMMNYKYNF